MKFFRQIALLCDKQVKLQLQIILPSFSHAVNKSYSESSARSEFLNNTYQRNNLSKPVTYIGFDLLGDVKDELHNNTFVKKSGAVELGVVGVQLHTHILASSFGKNYLFQAKFG